MNCHVRNMTALQLATEVRKYCINPIGLLIMFRVCVRLSGAEFELKGIPDTNTAFWLEEKNDDNNSEGR
jgi:hypothetical protein